MMHDFKSMSKIAWDSNPELQARLTPCQQEVCQLVLRGLSVREVAVELHRSRETVADHVKEIYKRVGVNTRAQLVLAFAYAAAAPRETLTT